MIELFNNIFDAILNHKLAPILGSLVVIWLGYRLYTSKSTKDRRIQEFNDTAINFTATFENIKAVINQNPDLTVSQIADDILKRTYPGQKVAMVNLRRRMGWRKRRAFSKAWQQYENPENCGQEPFLSYQGIPWEVGKSYDRQYILDAIRHLVSFVNK